MFYFHIDTVHREDVEIKQGAIYLYASSSWLVCVINHCQFVNQFDESIMHHLQDHVDQAGSSLEQPTLAFRPITSRSPSHRGERSGQAGTDLQVNASNSRQTHNEALPSRGFSAVAHNWPQEMEFLKRIKTSGEL